MSEGGLPLRELQIGTEANGADGVLISIRDSGPGIRPENLDRLFDPFYTTKSASRRALPFTSRSLPLLNRSWCKSGTSEGSRRVDEIGESVQKVGQSRSMNVLTTKP
jgi:hypothetical protein